MPATREQILAWIATAKAQGATHLIVACDSFEDDPSLCCYPVHVMEGQDARQEAAKYDGRNMQRLMEVYNLGQDVEAQLSERRSFHYE